jgi:hypothetical protein
MHARGAMWPDFPTNVCHAEVDFELSASQHQQAENSQFSIAQSYRLAYCAM